MIDGKTIRNSLYNIITKLGSILFPVVTFSYVSRIFLAEGMGRINFARSLVSFFALFANLGISQYGVRECSKIKDNHEELSRSFFEIIVINLLSAVIAYILLFIFISSNSKAQFYQYEIILFSLTIFLGIIGADWLYTALEDYRYIALRSLVLQITALVMVLLFVHTKEDIYKYIIIQVIASAGGNIFGLLHLKKYISLKRFTHFGIVRHVRSILKLFLVIFFIRIFADMDTVMLGYLSTEKEVGLYSASNKISSVLSGMIASATAVFLPKIAYSFNKGDNEKVKSFLMTSMQGILMISIPISIGSCIFAERFILILSGKGFQEAALSSQILSIRTFLSPVNAMLLVNYLIPKEEEKEAIIITAAAAIGNIFLNYLLIPSTGAVGASVATVAAEAIELVFLYFFVRKQISFRDLFSTFPQCCICVIPVILIAYAASRIVNNNFLSIISGVVLSVPVYLFLLWRMHNPVVDMAIKMIRDRKNKVVQ